MNYALVTGASRGIGRAIAIQLAKDGYRVIINYKSNHEAARETLRLIEEAGGEAELLPFDVSQPDAINAAMDQWEAANPDAFIEVLVNNAGIIRDNLMLDMPAEDWHAVVDTNLNGFFYITRRVLEGMLMNHKGRIVNMSSIAGVQGFVGKVNYAAAKAALVGVTQSLAVELAPKGITVNAIAPGYIETEMLYHGIEDNHVDDAQIQAALQSIPMHRVGKPEEVAYLVSFLASDKAAYISGQVIGINGGVL